MCVGVVVPIRLAEVATAAFFERIDLSAHGFFAIDDKRCGFDWAIPPAINSDGTHDNTTRGHPFNYFTQGVGCCEVEIDVLTGDHHVIRAGEDHRVESLNQSEPTSNSARHERQS